MELCKDDTPLINRRKTHLIDINLNSNSDFSNLSNDMFNTILSTLNYELYFKSLEHKTLQIRALMYRLHTYIVQNVSSLLNVPLY